MKKQPTIHVSGNPGSNKVWLTTGLQPPADERSMAEQIKTHAQFQSYASGGSIHHINLNEHMKNDKKSRLIESMFNNYPIRYVTLTSPFSICNSCGKKVVGEMTVCGECESTDCSYYNRVIGYVRPCKRGNISKDLREADHSFWLESRTEEALRRTKLNEENLNDILEEITNAIG